MARTARISEEELRQALKLRDKATTATELRKAMGWSPSLYHDYGRGA
jgi:hypothetical protein